MKSAVLPALLVLIAMPAMAHVTANPNTGVAGKYFQTSFRITHGCEGSPTTSVTVKIPEGLFVVRPQAKPDWKITITKRPLEQPVETGHGKTVTEAVSEITWSGKLSDDQYDEFGLVTKLPDSAGKTLWFPVVQKCAKGENRWVEIPEDGQEWHDVAMPAPFVKLTKKAP
jgi:periplasmic copper chaperone A